jgi:adapter protein MecA 1/2
MKIEKLGFNKLKVSLTALDLRSLDLNLEKRNADADEIKRAFIRLIKIAEKETGFALNNSKLVIEAIPDNEDGFIVFVTKLNEPVPARRSRRKPVLKPKIPLPKTHSSLFRFENIEDVISLARLLRRVFIGKSSLYAYGGAYYLALFKSRTTMPGYGRACLLASEFGSRVFRASINETFLAEHGRAVVLHKAAETLRAHFSE